MSLNERGSASLLGAVVVMPLLFLLLTVGVETSRYFGARESLLAELDKEMATSLRVNDSSEQAQERLRKRVLTLGYDLVDLRVGIERQGQVLEGVVRGRYQVPIASLARLMTGGTIEGIPLVVSSRVRRPRASALIVLDRSVEEGANLCEADELRARTEAVSRLVTRLRDEGMERIEVAVFPDATQGITILHDRDELPRCSALDSSFARLESVQGVSVHYLPEPLTGAYQTAGLFLKASEVNAVERRTLIMMGSARGANVELFSTTQALVEREAEALGKSVRTVAILVDQSPDEVSSLALGSGGLGSILRISDEELRSPSFETALIRHTQGHSVIAR